MAFKEAEQINPEWGELDDYTWTNPVTISDYNASNKRYTVPHFGYVALRVSNGYSGYISGDGVYFDCWVYAPSGKNNTVVLPVVKGQKVFCGGVTSGYYYFIYQPFIKR